MLWAACKSPLGESPPGALLVLGFRNRAKRAGSREQLVLSSPIARRRHAPEQVSHDSHAVRLFQTRCPLGIRCRAWHLPQASDRCRGSERPGQDALVAPLGVEMATSGLHFGIRAYLSTEDGPSFSGKPSSAWPSRHVQSWRHDNPSQPRRS